MSADGTLIMIAVISIFCSTVIPTMVGLFIKKYFTKAMDKRDRDKKELEELREADLKEKQLASLKIVLEPLQKQIDSVVNGSKASLRNQILNAYYDCREKGYRTAEDSENFIQMHKAYHELGGNSFIDSDISPVFNSLPLKSDNYVNGKEIKPRRNRKSSTAQPLVESK